MALQQWREDILTLHSQWSNPLVPQHQLETQTNEAIALALWLSGGSSEISLFWVTKVHLTLHYVKCPGNTLGDTQNITVDVTHIAAWIQIIADNEDTRVYSPQDGFPGLTFGSCELSV